MAKRIRIYYKYHCTKMDMLAYVSLTFSFSVGVLLALGII
jgi:hypothetical protein